MSGQIPDHLGNVGPGWHNILTVLHDALRFREPKYQVAQLKEKFGGLRLYLENPLIHPNSDELILFAEALCDRTCETCGLPGTASRRSGSANGWIKTLCPEHTRERDMTDAFTAAPDPLPELVTTEPSPGTGTEESSTSHQPEMSSEPASAPRP